MVYLTKSRKDPATGLETVPRKEHVRDFASDYRDGHHYTGMGPTGRGKTTLAKQHLIAVTSPDRKALVLHGKIKGRDPVIGEMADQCNLRIISTYPPNYSPRDKNRNGYILRPLDHHARSAAEENQILSQEFRKGIHANYTTSSKRKRITVIDESHQAQETLKLKEEIEGPLMRGAPDNGVWNLLQRGRYVSYHCYSAPEHLIIFYDPDRTNQQRYSEIGDVDPEEIVNITSNLRTERSKDGRTISQALYMRRGDRYMCIVDT